MDWDDFLPAALTVIVALVAALVAALVLALKAIFDTRELRAQFAGLGERFLLLDHRLAGLNEEVARLAPPPPEAAAAAGAAPPASIVEEVVESTPEPAAEAAEMPPAEPAAAAAPAGRGWEQVLVENWLVWLGGATIAL